MGVLIRRWAVLAVLVCLLAWFGPAQAQDTFNGDTIGDVRVEGNQRIEADTVLSYIQINPGDQFEADEVDRALKALFGTGLFADVTIGRDGETLVVKVVENPIINRLAFEGNRRIEDKVLQAEVQLRPRVVYTAARAQADAKRILDIYRRSGRFAATVEPKIIPLPQNRVDLVFEVTEGDITEVGRIDFIGNKVFSDSELRGEILTKESAWYRFLSSSDTYDPDRITVDRESLRNFYLTEGYADFRVISSNAELSPDQKAFFITFTIEEGERYKFGLVNLETSLKDLDPESLRSDVSTEEGDWYNAQEVELTIGRITDRVGDLGYAFVQVEPLLDKDSIGKIINVTYDIREGPRVYVERIDISGNVRTLDKVIRREFQLVEGDAFNSSKIRRSRQRIQNLGFFSKVDLNTIEGSNPDRTIVQVEVEEQSTGELSFGIGYSTNEGPIGDITLRERNLLGKGQDLRLGFVLSGRRSQIDLSFTEPYFMDRNLSAGVDAFYVRTNQSESSFDEKSIGGGFRFGWEWADYLRQTVRYTISQDEIFNIEPDASPAVQQQRGTSVSSVVSQELVYDRRNNRLFPTDGYVVRFRNDLAGLGGDVRYLRTRIGGGYYQPVVEGVVASINADFGYIQGFGQDVRITDAFFLGGSTLRGFEVAGVGPRDVSTPAGDSLGGNKYFSGSAELLFPLGLPEEYQISGRIFSDFGTLFDTDATVGTIRDSDSMRVSIGGGFTWVSQFGPLAVDLGYPVVKEDFDREEFFRFSIGTRF
ncbi:MAG: outer membrane protein assembly factor BamA [Dongiaceae bacterium]